MKMNHKSQAATEFMVTYGWAILGVMVVVGALAYFGVFNTDRFVNDECSFGNQLYCEDFKLTGGSNPRLYLTFRNNFGQEIHIGKIIVTSGGVDWDFDNSDTDVIVETGGSVSFSDLLTSAPTLSTKDKVKMVVIVDYNRAVPNAPSHNITGTIIATVQ